MRNTFVSKVIEHSIRNNNVYFLTADLGYMSVEPIAEAIGHRYINVGIAEANMIGVASGLSKAGNTVYVYTMAQFVTLRCYEQIRITLAQGRRKVIIVGVGAGYSYGNQGASHHSVEDVSVMCAMPGMKVFIPADPWDVAKFMDGVEELDGPVYMRLAKAGEPMLEVVNRDFQFGKMSCLLFGEDGVIFSYGDVLEKVLSVVKKIRKKYGINLSVYNAHTMKPFDEDLVEDVCSRVKYVFTVEQNVARGGLASHVAMVIASRSLSVTKFKSFSIQDLFQVICGEKDYLEDLDGLSEKNMEKEIVEIVQGLG